MIDKARARRFRCALLILLFVGGPAWPVQSTPQPESEPPPVKEARPEAVHKPTDHQDKGHAERRKPKEPMQDASNRITKPVKPKTSQPRPDARYTKAQEELRDIARRDLTAQQIMAKFTRQLAQAAWIALVVTSVGVLLIWRTLVHTRKAAVFAGQAVEQSRRAANAATTAAEAGQAAVRVASDTAERQLRAYVSVVEATVTWQSRQSILATIVLQNTGQTPALNVHKAYVVSTGEPDDFDVPEPDETAISHSIGAGVPMTLYAPVSRIPEDEWQGIRSRAMPFYVWGEVRYDDIFGKTPRFTKFRLILLRENDGLGPCEGGNESN